MKCQHCKKKTATIHLTEIVNENEKHEIHLCEDCAKAKGIGFKAHFSIQDLLTNLVGETQEGELAQLDSSNCPVCGIHYTEFRAGGRFGCMNDYRVFSAALDSLFDKIHHARRHKGKVPRRAGSNIAKAEMIDDLKERLNEAIDREEYEEAAALRDRIRQLEDES